jgi:hypothetical protein
MEFSGPLIGFAFAAMGTVGWMFTTWIRARHGYPVTDDWGRTIGKADAGATRRIEDLSSENAALKDKVGAMEERLKVLERIATDPAERTAREIETLR